MTTEIFFSHVFETSNEQSDISLNCQRTEMYQEEALNVSAEI